MINYIYKTLLIPVSCSNKDYEYLKSLNKMSADVWNLCLKLNEDCKTQTGEYIGLSDLQKQTKKCVNLHTKGIQHIVHKYLYARSAMFQSIKAKHDNSSKVKLPYKVKKFLSTGWDSQSIKVNYEEGYLLLSKPLGYDFDEGRIIKLKPIKCFAKIIPENIAEIELIYRDKYYLAIKYKEDANKYYQVKSDNVASIDLGEIHTITSVDNNQNAIIITGRKMRSFKYFRNKELSKLRGKRNSCKAKSNNWYKYNKAIRKLTNKSDRKILDCVHKITKLYLDYCLENNINKVYYGDLDSCTRDTKKKRHINKYVGEKLNQWNYGQVMDQLHNKLSRYRIELVEVKEYYTSQKCPKCCKLNKPKGRNYTCGCGYKQHRDIVGAINILNDNSKHHIEHYNSKKYLQIA